MNINEKLKKIDGNHYDVLVQVGKIAESIDLKAYLVGGMVRDILLDFDSLDIDITVENDAIKLAKKLDEQLENCSVKALHENFNTAKVVFDYGGMKIEVDLATTREEIYDEPAALPKVEVSTLEKDLIRRDFTINALAVSLLPADFGEVVDIYGGLDDLEKKLIRILPNEKSFIDDPTRMIRAVRFATKFGYEIEENTKKLFNEAIDSKQFDNLIENIRGDRVRIELEYLFNLDDIETSIKSFYSTKLYTLVSTTLSENEKIVLELIKPSNKFISPSGDRWLVYLGLILFNAKASDYLSMLQLNSKQVDSVVNAIDVWKFLNGYEKESEINNFTVYKKLNSLDGVTFLILRARATLNSDVLDWITKYMTELCLVKLKITGDDLISIGFKQGKEIGEGLDYVLKTMLEDPSQSYDKNKQLDIAKLYMSKAS